MSLCWRTFLPRYKATVPVTTGTTQLCVPQTSLTVLHQHTICCRLDVSLPSNPVISRIICWSMT